MSAFGVYNHHFGGACRRDFLAALAVSRVPNPGILSERGECIMFATQEETTRNIRKDTPPESDPAKIDRNAPAGGEDSLGPENVRDGRPQRTIA
jgi:hypothetical protein